MSPPFIPTNKIRKLIALWTTSIFNKTLLANRLRISRGTARKYIAAYERSGLASSGIERLSNADLFGAFALFDRSIRRVRSVRYIALSYYLERIHTRMQNEPISLFDIWIAYSSKMSEPYKYSQFANRYNSFCKERQLKTPQVRPPVVIRPNDLTILYKWKRSTNRRLWERAVAILAMSEGDNVANIGRKVERSPRIIKRWCHTYTVEGLARLALRRTKRQSIESLDNLKLKTDRLIKLIHESPSLHGINRASWSLATLVKVYEALYGASVSRSSISEYFRTAGYKFKKAKKVLTSSDPEYREKLSKITQILSHLRTNEKFFSIDEFGPFSVRVRGGIALASYNEVRTIPQRQKSRGRLICTAALELSTNQVTHFYSPKKNTGEMIKLMMVLLEKYRTDQKIFLSWDSASWHASNALYKKVKEVNSEQYRSGHMAPIVELAPLPTGAQFLNVIESVFSGMSRAVLHNSDYQSVMECTMAIDKHFFERNKAFAADPRRAGNKIWGKERVEAVFKEENNCKDPDWR